MGGKTVNGLSIGCKNGYVYELDRETGKPVTPVREEPLDNAKTDPQAKAFDEAQGWEGLGVDAPPIVYTVDGTQYVVYVVTVEGKAALLGFALNAKEPAPLVPKSQTPAQATSGQSVFTSNCGSCHTLAAAETAGTIGPDLDQLKPSEATVEHQVINDGDRMPSFQKRLSAAQIKAVAEYVSEVAGKSGEVPAKNSEVAHKGGE